MLQILNFIAIVDYEQVNTGRARQGIIQKKSESRSWTLPCLEIFFSKSYFDLKMPKMVFK